MQRSQLMIELLFTGKIGMVPYPRHHRRSRNPRLGHSGNPFGRNKGHEILYRCRLRISVDKRIGILRIFRLHILVLHIDRTKCSRRQPKNKSQCKNKYISDKTFHAANILKIWKSTRIYPKFYTSPSPFPR